MDFKIVKSNDNQKSLKNQRGQILKILLVLAGILFVVILVAIVVLRTTSLGKSLSNQEPQNGNNTENEIPEPVYEATIGDIRFVFESAINLGNLVKSNNPIYPTDLKTTEKFVRVVIGAQNKGNFNVVEKSWELGNIIDANGRNFVPILDPYKIYIPQPDLCGTLLKPEFEPVPCVKIYEVSNVSNNLKIEVKTTGKQGKTSYVDLFIE